MAIKILKRPEQLTPSNFGLNLSQEQLVTEVVAAFSRSFDDLTVDELLCRPREALAFCDAFRSKCGCIDLPDDLILGALTRRLCTR